MSDNTLIPIVIEKNGAGREARAGYSGCGGDITKGPITLVVKKFVAAIVRDVEIRAAIVVIVADGHSKPKALTTNARFFGYILKPASAQIPV